MLSLSLLCWIVSLQVTIHRTLAMRRACLCRCPSLLMVPWRWVRHAGSLRKTTSTTIQCRCQLNFIYTHIYIYYIILYNVLLNLEYIYMYYIYIIYIYISLSIYTFIYIWHWISTYKSSSTRATYIVTLTLMWFETYALHCTDQDSKWHPSLVSHSWVLR